MKIRKFAAIDLGSNAIRLLISNVIEEKGEPTKFKKNSLVRAPIRLGQDAFTFGEISERNCQRIIDAIKSFKLLMSIHEVEKYSAYATSAMREARNNKQVVSSVENHTGVKINIIDGKEEAAIIAATDLRHFIKKENTYLYVDVGGGSTEFTIFHQGNIILSRSFKIGTVRLLNKVVKKSLWEEMELWIKTHTEQYDVLSVIGSGGNINKLFKISGQKQGSSLSVIWLNAQYQFMQSLSYEERISKLGLNSDRADVIVPATRIYLMSCKWSGAREIHVPKIGLADGIIRMLYQKSEPALHH